jgi:hypothetical protein
MADLQRRMQRPEQEQVVAARMAQPPPATAV